jgi:ribosomal RNA assembly protein
MRSILVSNMKKIKRAVPAIENRVKVHIGFGKNRISVKGNELNEYLVEQIVQAIDFGFDIDDALLLLNQEFVLEFIDVKEHTRRKNLRDVRSRIIGTEGRAKRTIEKLTGAAIVISDNRIGVIVDADHLSATIQGIEGLISGSKHGNVFGFLERQGYKVNRMDEDLGLKEGVDEGDYEDGQDD